MTFTTKFVWTASYISAVMGEECTSIAEEPPLAAWPSSEKGQYLCTIFQKDDEIIAKLFPVSDTDWAKAYQIIGCCAYHGHKWESH